MAWLLGRARTARNVADGAGGFSLLEVIVALALMLFVMSASVPFFVRSLQVSATQQVREAAISLADQAMEQARSFTPTAMLQNRDQATATNKWGRLPAAASAYTNSSVTVVAYDPNPLVGQSRLRRCPTACATRRHWSTICSTRCTPGLGSAGSPPRRTRFATRRLKPRLARRRCTGSSSM